MPKKLGVNTIKSTLNRSNSKIGEVLFSCKRVVPVRKQWKHFNVELWGPPFQTFSSNKSFAPQIQKFKLKLYLPCLKEFSRSVKSCSKIKRIEHLLTQKSLSSSQDQTNKTCKSVHTTVLITHRGLSMGKGVSKVHLNQQNGLLQATQANPRPLKIHHLPTLAYLKQPNLHMA